MGLDDCHVCGRQIPGDSPAVGISETGGESRIHYVPFVEDLRSTELRLVHLQRFAEARGIDALIEAIHEHDRRTRKEIADLVDRVFRHGEPSSGADARATTAQERRGRLISSMLQCAWFVGAGVLLVVGVFTGHLVQGSFTGLALVSLGAVEGIAYRAQAAGRLSESKALVVRLAAVAIICFLLYLGLRFVP